MSKYTSKQLSEMSRQLLEAKAAMDDRYLHFVITVALTTGKDPQEIEDTIEE